MRTQTGETAGRKEALTVSRLIEGQMLSNNNISINLIFFICSYFGNNIRWSSSVQFICLCLISWQNISLFDYVYTLYENKMFFFQQSAESRDQFKQIRVSLQQIRRSILPGQSIRRSLRQSIWQSLYQSTGQSIRRQIWRAISLRGKLWQELP